MQASRVAEQEDTDHLYLASHLVAELLLKHRSISARVRIQSQSGLVVSDTRLVKTLRSTLLHRWVEVEVVAETLMAVLGALVAERQTHGQQLHVLVVAVHRGKVTTEVIPQHSLALTVEVEVAVLVDQALQEQLKLVLKWQAGTASLHQSLVHPCIEPVAELDRLDQIKAVVALAHTDLELIKPVAVVTTTTPLVKMAL